MQSKKILLNNGFSVTNLCFGTGITYGEPSTKERINHFFHIGSINEKQYKKNIGLSSVIDVAMNNGCCMFDTSRAYGMSEKTLGNTLKKYKRQDYTIVTKVCNGDQYKKNIRDAFEKSLKELQMEYIDIYLFHWPVENYFLDTWKQMEKIYEEGLCKAIGVCNCNIHHLDAIFNQSNIKPAINEFECHPLFTQNVLRDFCKKNQIQVMAYTSTARSDERLKKTILVPLAKKYNKSITQIILRWHQQIGNIPIVNTTSVNHMLQNTQLLDFDLSDEEIQCITMININSRLRYDPDNCDFKQL